MKVGAGCEGSTASSNFVAPSGAPVVVVVVSMMFAGRKVLPVSPDWPNGRPDKDSVSAVAWWASGDYLSKGREEQDKAESVATIKEGQPSSFSY